MISDLDNPLNDSNIGYPAQTGLVGPGDDAGDAGDQLVRDPVLQPSPDS